MTLIRIAQSILCAALLWVAGSAFAAPAEDALVVLYQPRTVRGEAAGLHMRVHGGPANEAIELPHTRVAQPMQSLFDGHLVALLAQGTGGGSPFGSDTARELLLFQVAPPKCVYAPWSPEWEPVTLLAEESPINGECRLALLERRRNGTAPPRGRVRVLGVQIKNASIQFVVRGQWDLHAAPAAGAVSWKTGELYVACDGPRAGMSAIVAIDLASGEQRYAPFPMMQQGMLSVAPAALAITQDGSQLALLESAYSLERRDGGRVSTLRLLESATLQDTGKSIGIAGAGSGVGRVFARRSEDLVISTADDAAGFAYVTAMTTSAAILTKRGEWAFRDATTGSRVAPSPDGAMLALAGGKSLRVFGPESESPKTFNVRDAIEAIAWTRNGVYVGAGPRLGRFDGDSSLFNPELEMFSGFIVDLLPIAAINSPIAESGVDRLQLPPRVHLDADTPGRDQRVITIKAPRGADLRLVHDAPAAPWLTATLIENAPDEFHLMLSLNKQSMQQPGEYRSPIRVELSEAMSDDLIEVVASSYAKGTRAIEWQSSTGFGPLMRLVSAAPLHLSHRIRRGPVAQAPRGTAAVVVRLEDVARGAITRQVLLDYVSGGGGLLVVAGHSPEIAAEGLRRWLEPLGLLIDPAQDVTGRFPVPQSSVAAFGLDQLAVSAGAYVETTRPMEFTVPGPQPGTSVLALARHGYGRLAVLASGSPLEDVALSQGGYRRFGRALFDWLTGANGGVSDSDNDGLRDDIEDADASGAKSARETDYLNPDTDGDGIPDGLEDANLNGVVDEGETDPRRADSDADGLPDGADADPLPPVGTPVILAVQPQGGPAEGGTLVELTGRNLPVNPQVWFGERRASVMVRTDSTRVVAASPPRIFGELSGPVVVRIADPLDLNEHVFKEAYTYHPPSAVELVLAPAARVRRVYDGYRGLFSLSLDIPDVRIDAAAFYLRTEPALNGLEAIAVPSATLTQAGRALQLTKYGDSEFRVVIGPGEPLTGRTALGTVSWRLPNLASPVNAIRWYVLYPDVRVLWGSNVDVLSNDVEIHLDTLDAKSIPARPPDPAAML